LRPSIAAEIAYFQARFRGDAATARARLDQAQGGFLERHDRLRAEAAVLLAEHRVAEARQRAFEALAALPEASVTDAGSAIMHAEWLRDIGAPPCENGPLFSQIRAVAIAQENSTALRTGLPD
jgi:hypothetical protein